MHFLYLNTIEDFEYNVSVFFVGVGGGGGVMKVNVVMDPTDFQCMDKTILQIMFFRKKKFRYHMRVIKR